MRCTALRLVLHRLRSADVADGALCQRVGYDNAGTVEFLYDMDSKEWFFIEMNPRIQVEHTVTEVVTGLDLVRAQILIAQGHRLTSPELGLPAPGQVPRNGYAIQCRVTTEDPTNKFVPDHGRLSHYRSAGGLGIRPRGVIHSGRGRFCRCPIRLPGIG